MEKQSGTVSGKWSTLVDNAKELGLGIGNGLLPAMGGLIDFSSSLLQNLQPFRTLLQAFGAHFSP